VFAVDKLIGGKLIKHVAILICLISPYSAIAQKPAPPAKPAPSAAPERRPATLAQQKMCAEGARKFWQEDNEYRGEAKKPVTEYTSHYDPKVNVC